MQILGKCSACSSFRPIIACAFCRRATGSSRFRHHGRGGLRRRSPRICQPSRPTLPHHVKALRKVTWRDRNAATTSPRAALGRPPCGGICREFSSRPSFSSSEPCSVFPNTDVPQPLSLRGEGRGSAARWRGPRQSVVDPGRGPDAEPLPALLRLALGVALLEQGDRRVPRRAEALGAFRLIDFLDPVAVLAHRLARPGRRSRFGQQGNEPPLQRRRPGVGPFVFARGGVKLRIASIWGSGSSADSGGRLSFIGQCEPHWFKVGKRFLYPGEGRGPGAKRTYAATRRPGPRPRRTKLRCSFPGKRPVVNIGNNGDWLGGLIPVSVILWRPGGPTTR